MALAKHSGAPAENQVSRRNLLNAAVAAIPVATVAAIGSAFATGDANAAACAALLAGEPETPVATAFRQWMTASAAMQEAGLSQDAMDRLIVDRAAADVQLNSLTATTPMDVLMQVCAATDFGLYGIGDTGMETGWYYARQMLGGAV